MGGKAFTNTVSINMSSVRPTVTWLADVWPGSGIQEGPWTNHILGSAGKNPMSGDIDLNLEITKYDQAVVAAELTVLLGAENVRARPAHNQIFTSVPIAVKPGETPGQRGRVQIDFMFGDYAWQKFSYWSPEVMDIDHPVYYTDRSAFKGLYRTEFIKALTAYNSDWILEEHGEMVARVGPTFFHDRGLVWRYRYRPWKIKDPTTRIQAFRETTEEEFMKLFPSALKISNQEMKDPDQVVKFLSNEALDAKSFNTLEYIVDSMYGTYSPQETKKVAQIYIERLNSLKVLIPTKKLNQLGLRV